MTLRVLNVAYPFSPIGPNAVGGAEQVVTQLDAALVERGHESLVIGCAGSSIQGELISTAACTDKITDHHRAIIYKELRAQVVHTIATRQVDVVHLHGVDFYQYLPPGSVPTLATLHLPPHWYPREIFEFKHRDIHLVPVSKSQARACPPSSNLLPPIANGVAVERFVTRHAKRNFAICLGRICPEKGFHIAVDVAKKSHTPLLIAGEVFRYDTHVHYFTSELSPKLDGLRRFIGPLGFERKRRFLSAARCLIVPSLVPETSSLVAMEALACGTPVIAFPCGELPNIVEHGKTGFVVRDEREMAAALRVVHLLDSEECRKAARQRFCVGQTMDRYIALYERLATHSISHEVVELV